ncbi:MAG: hypothetical protein IJL87_05505 [Clostridia bacterium]|nr:hypothetical protein [Clostridia bacterium]
MLIFWITAFVGTFFLEAKQDRPWKSGQVQIAGKNIQLPCDVDIFESTLNTKIVDSKFSDVIKNVEINIDSAGTLKFNVYVENNLVTGIMVDAKRSNPNEDSFITANERYLSENIVFPGNVTIETPIKEIKKLYGTKPFNSSYTYWDEKIGL